MMLIQVFSAFMVLTLTLDRTYGKPQGEDLTNETVLPVLPEEDIKYSFFPEINSEFAIDAKDTGATIRGMFGITDYQGIFMYTTIIVSFLTVLAKSMGITLFPGLTATLERLTDRLDIGVNGIKEGVATVKKQIRGRGLPLDEVALDSITDVVYKALDAYEGFNEIQ
ncbi:hypothetical protein TCAL_08710 [Tigriopus californicus]|uniref:Uncharacterized protein n=1 Tax=Tigriopus californicus TaxID=6832 RepID=A0A553P0K4_TIGCA|nr:uncharacterized protein LOC131886875 [Tigriopus californicus]TRY71207.1 hypothetical protein TCAL_08710 [Tigriopus californicus]